VSIDTVKDSINVDEFEIVKQGTASFPGLTLSSTAGNFTAGEATTTVAHNLGYTPGILLNVLLASGSSTEIRNLPYGENPVATNFGDWFVLQAYADNTNLYLLTDLLVYGNASSIVTSSFVAQYYLLKERIKRSI
jgi:hypothetical protein